MSPDIPLMEFTVLSQSLGAHLLLNSGRAGFSSVSIDSRTVQEGALFVALTGSVNDGHSFVESAFACGACAAMVDSSKVEQYNLVNTAKNLKKDLILVDNTLRGLQKAAQVYLEGFPGLIKIGITGSSGKTTTKEIAAAIIGTEKCTVMNSGNLNSETGLPVSVFAVRSCHETGIFEMGMNRRGEIAELAEVLKPNIAVITNIGSAHIGILGSKRAIAEEKKNIFSCFTGTELALIPADDQYRDFLAQGVNGRVSFFGADTLKELGEIKSLGLSGAEIVWEGEKIHFALPGRHNLANAVAALALAPELKISGKAVKQGMESVRPLFGRTEILQGKVTVIRDCYNANPESLEMALDFCDSLEWPGRKIYVIADMLELGADSPRAHEHAGELLAGCAADKIFLFGTEIKAAGRVLQTLGPDFSTEKSFPARKPVKPFYMTDDMAELSGVIEKEITDGDLVLLKGSRGCALERLCEIPVLSAGGNF